MPNNEIKKAILDAGLNKELVKDVINLDKKLQYSYTYVTRESIIDFVLSKKSIECSNFKSIVLIFFRCIQKLSPDDFLLLIKQDLAKAKVQDSYTYLDHCLEYAKDQSDIVLFADLFRKARRYQLDLLKFVIEGRAKLYSDDNSFRNLCSIILKTKKDKIDRANLLIKTTQIFSVTFPLSVDDSKAIFDEMMNSNAFNECLRILNDNNALHNESIVGIIKIISKAKTYDQAHYSAVLVLNENFRNRKDILELLKLLSISKYAYYITILIIETKDLINENISCSFVEILNSYRNSEVLLRVRYLIKKTSLLSENNYLLILKSFTSAETEKRVDYLYSQFVGRKGKPLGVDHTEENKALEKFVIPETFHLFLDRVIVHYENYDINILYQIYGEDFKLFRSLEFIQFHADNKYKTMAESFKAYKEYLLYLKEGQDNGKRLKRLKDNQE